jgi:tripartite-type tricarboxylate transporter receptor subunit TctC
MGFPSTLGSLIDAGTVRVLATAGSERMFEDVPTLAEVGVEGDIGFMHRVVLAPKGTPDDVVAILTEAFGKLVEDKTFTRMMGRLNETIDLLDGAEYQVMREEQDAAYAELVKALTSQ